jgi:hypothetical protein
MKTQKASELLKIWQEIRRHLFSLEALFAIILELKRLSDEGLYLDLRNTSNQKLLEFIDYLCALPYQEWTSAVWHQPLTIQVFLYDRVNYVEEYLGHLGQADISHVTEIGEFVKDTLVNWWNQRDREIHR